MFRCTLTWRFWSPDEAAEWELFTFPLLCGENHSTTSSCPVRSVKMSATGTGGCGPGPGPSPGPGSSNPRKFSEKIALHTQRQAEETAAFQEVMMDITSTRVSPRRRQEAESCPEEERPCPGLSSSEITICLYMALGWQVGHLRETTYWHYSFSGLCFKSKVSKNVC